jgi:uncharacterized protein
MLLEKIQTDLKEALLSGDKLKSETLKSIKNSVIYARVAGGRSSDTITEEELVKILIKESKKRQEAADLYQKGGNSDMSKKEQLEKQIIDAYLPKALTDEEIEKLVEDIASKHEITDSSEKGKLIGLVIAAGGPSVDGSKVARIATELLSKLG